MEYKEIKETLNKEYYLFKKDSVLATFGVALVAFFGGLKIIYDKAVDHGSVQAKLYVEEELKKIAPEEIYNQLNTMVTSSNISLNKIIKIESNAKILESTIQQKASYNYEIKTPTSAPNKKTIIVSGQTNSTDWNNYNNNGGVFTEVDISEYNFEETPQIFTSLSGGSGAWITRGTSSIYEQSGSSFKIYLAPWVEYNAQKEGSIFNTQQAKKRNFKMNWIAIGTKKE